MRKVKAPFPNLKGFVAAPASAWGSDFALMLDLPEAGYEEVGNAAVVDICGPLTQHTAFFYPSYDVIRAACLAAFASDKEMVVLRIDSPGGDFAGSLELARALRAMAAAAKKRLVAFTDGSALSAAYAIACAADEIVITPSAFVGSVGVWSAIVDETARDKAMGLNVEIVSSGEAKAERNPHVKISQGALTRLQAEVDGMAGLFFDAVAELRGFKRSDVVRLQGAQHFGEHALKLGLANRIVDSFDEVFPKKGVAAMPKYLDEAKALLAKAAEGDDEDSKKARAFLKAWDDDGKEDKAKKAKAEAEEEEKKKEEARKAKAEEEEKEAKARAAAQAQASGAAPSNIELAAEIQRLNAQIVAAAEASERKDLLASRPDFSDAVRKTLASASLATVKEAVENWPRAALPHEGSVNALTPNATPGAGVKSPAPRYVMQETEGEYIDRKLRTHQSKGGIVNNGCSQELHFMTPEEARAHLGKLEAEKAAAAKEGR